MEGVKEQVLTFLDKCEKLKTSKFIMATDGIKEILKSIVNSPALYELFGAVTKDFDYLATKRACFVTETLGYVQKSYIKLPSKTSEILAFIFCILVEFDHETLNLTEFLLQYFPEDKTCYASFHSFCDKIIVTFEDIVKDIFSEELAETPEPEAESVQSEQMAAQDQKINIISILISHEKDVIMQTDMTDKDKQDGMGMLTALEQALREGNGKSVEAYLCGYDYFTRCHGGYSNFLDLLSEELG